MAEDADALAAMVTEGATAVVIDVLASAAADHETPHAAADTLARYSAPEQFEQLLSRSVELLALLTECRAAVPMVSNAHAVASLLQVMTARTRLHLGVPDKHKLKYESGIGALRSENEHDSFLLCCSVALENIAFDAQGGQELQRALVQIEQNNGVHEGVHKLLDLLNYALNRADVAARELAYSLMRSLLVICPEPSLAKRIVGATDSPSAHGSGKSDHDGVLSLTAVLRTWSDDKMDEVVFAILAQLAHSLPCAKRITALGVHRLALKKMQLQPRSTAQEDVGASRKLNSEDASRVTLSTIGHCLQMLELQITLIGETFAQQLKAQRVSDIVASLHSRYGKQHEMLHKQCNTLLDALYGRRSTVASVPAKRGKKSLSRGESRRHTDQIAAKAASARRLEKLRSDLGSDTVAEEVEVFDGELPPPPLRPPAASNAPPPPPERPPAASIAPPPPPLPDTLVDDNGQHGGTDAPNTSSVRRHSAGPASTARRSLLAARLSHMNVTEDKVDAVSGELTENKSMRASFVKRRSTFAKVCVSQSIVHIDSIC